MMDYKQLETTMEKAITSLKERLADIMEIAQIGGMLDEQNRIIKLLEPLAKHDEEMCSLGCYPEDCSASIYQDVIELIRAEEND